MLQGMTAHYLCYDTFPLKPGDTALVHAAAGGVGLLLVQMAHHLGARVIGTVSSEEKAKLAREAGALARVPMGLITGAVIDAWSGELAKAADATAEADAIVEATGTRLAP